MDKYLEKLKTMETGAITDSLKLLGLDGWMVGIHPVNPDGKICGRAFTIKYSFEQDPKAPSDNYYALLDEIKEDDVILLAANGCNLALMGENMTHATEKMKAAGIILDGMNRDTPVIRHMDFPVFSKGHEVKFMPGNMKITDHQIPVSFAGTIVRPGDYIIGDADGVIVIPESVIEEVMFQAERITEIENEMEAAIQSGKSMKECVRIIGQKKFKREH